jgi:hypothetical protein
MPKFTHIVFTRFNARFDAPWTELALDPAWLKHRFGLFERFCYPSVRSQTNDNFKWLLFFSDRTPKEYVDKINKMAKAWPVMKPRFHDYLSSENIVAETLGCVDKGSEFLITSTLDNDDSISRNFIEETQNQFHGQKFQYVNWASGYVYYADKNRFYKRTYLQSPFNSLIERVDGCKLVWSTSHHEIMKTGPVIQIDKNPGWIQVVHDYNISNRIKGVRIAVPDVGRDFEIKLPESRKESRLDIFMDRYLLSLFRLMRDGLILVAKKVVDLQALKHWLQKAKTGKRPS